jgi:hypothetical protein
MKSRYRAGSLVVAIIVCLVSAFAVSAGTAPGSPDRAAGKKTYAPKDCNRPRVKPSRIVFFCADAGVYYTAKNWKYWNNREGGGKGKIHANDCKPACAGGTYHTYKARIRVYRPRVQKCGGRRVRLFQKAEVRFLRSKPKALHRTERFALDCN